MKESPVFFYKNKLSSSFAPKELVVYLKTTETCQLNCKHCFTNGINGKKIYFDPHKTVEWFHRLYEDFPSFQGGSIIFHGGEPFLAPIEDMIYVWERVSPLWKNISWSCSTNLVYTLTDEHISFFKTVLKNGFCTSWDKDIRFENQKQESLWRKNLATLVGEGCNITLNISLNRNIIEMNQLELVEWLNTLGVNHVQFERLTAGGNAIKNTEIFPTNAEVSEWLFNLYKLYETIKPEYNDVLINNIKEASLYGVHGGIRCRDCEQKIFTINADGSISGCPNSAVDNSFGDISMDISKLLTSPKRLNNISCEIARDHRCFECDVFENCNSDCHQLEWQGDICPSPKKLLRYIKVNK
jgi:radical SAM protein with 4Fe4S-binding SPASM domain